MTTLDVAVTDDGRPFEHVLQFADIARPSVGKQRLESIVQQTRRTATHGATDLRKKMICE
jgi:hypothetical protein